jgi:hypothetical protein
VRDYQIRSFPHQIAITTHFFVTERHSRIETFIPSRIGRAAQNRRPLREALLYWSERLLGHQNSGLRGCHGWKRRSFGLRRAGRKRATARRRRAAGPAGASADPSRRRQRASTSRRRLNGTQGFRNREFRNRDSVLSGGELLPNDGRLPLHSARHCHRILSRGLPGCPRWTNTAVEVRADAGARTVAGMAPFAQSSLCAIIQAHPRVPRRCAMPCAGRVSTEGVPIHHRHTFPDSHGPSRISNPAPRGRDIEPIAYDEIEHVRITKGFLSDPEKFLTPPLKDW